MTVQHNPAPARSDVPTAYAESRPGDRPYFRHGMLLSAGAAAWALSMVILGGVGSADASAAEAVVLGIGGGLFQLGLLALIRVLYLSQALGTGRVARGFLKVEAGMVVLAIASTFVDAIRISDLDQTGWALLDAFWPLSMMGMFGIAIRIAIAGRWRGVARYWPLVAESWALVVIPTMNIFGTTAAGVVAVVHLLVGYTVLGQIVARKRD